MSASGTDDPTRVVSAIIFQVANDGTGFDPSFSKRVGFLDIRNPGRVDPQGDMACHRHFKGMAEKTVARDIGRRVAFTAQHDLGRGAIERSHDLDCPLDGGA